MSATLASPVNIKAEPRDNSVFMSWDPVEGADGYTVYFYKADAPDKCVKKRITHGTSRTFHGFNNGSKYQFFMEISSKRNPFPQTMALSILL